MPFPGTDCSLRWQGCLLAALVAVAWPALAREPRAEDQRDSRVEDHSGRGSDGPRETREIRETQTDSVREVREVRTDPAREVPAADRSGSSSHEVREVKEVQAPASAEPRDQRTSDARSGSETVRTEVRDASSTSSGQSGSSRVETDRSGSSDSSGSIRTSVDRTGSSGSSGSGSSVEDRSGSSGSSGSDNSGSGRSGSGDSSDSGSSGSGHSGSGDSSGSGSSGSGHSGSGDSSGSGSSGSDHSGSSGSSGSGSSNSGSGSGKSGNDDASGNSGSSSMKGLAERERPQFDSEGFPVRRDEVLALNADPAALRRSEAAGFSVIETISVRGLGAQMLRLSIPQGMPPGEALKQLRDNDRSGIYDFDHYYAAEVSQSAEDSATPAQLPAARAPLDRRTRIGVIDTAIPSHPSLGAVKLESKRFTDAPAELADHGLGVASVLASQGARNIVSANVFRGTADRPFTDAATLAAAINWMVEEKIPVINVSIAGPHNNALDRLVRLATDQGHVIVAAVGNQGPTAPPAYPAASSGAVGVTAVDAQRQVYRMANRGNYVRYAALGVHVPTAAPGGTRYRSGTSFAAAQVSVALAACLNRISARAAAACLSGLDKSAIDLGAPGRDPVYGVGLVTRN